MGKENTTIENSALYIATPIEIPLAVAVVEVLDDTEDNDEEDRREIYCKPRIIVAIENRFAIHGLTNRFYTCFLYAFRVLLLWTMAQAAAAITAVLY